MTTTMKLREMLKRQGEILDFLDSIGLKDFQIDAESSNAARFPTQAYTHAGAIWAKATEPILTDWHGHRHYGVYNNSLYVAVQFTMAWASPAGHRETHIVGRLETVPLKAWPEKRDSVRAVMLENAPNIPRAKVLEFVEKCDEIHRREVGQMEYEAKRLREQLARLEAQK